MFPTLGFLILSLVIVPSPAIAGSDWDPDDVEGPFDIRWYGAAFTSSGDVHLTLSFYDDFRHAALPWTARTDLNVRVEIQPVATGYLLRRAHGRIVFSWGDYGSNCCERAPVTRLAPGILDITFDPGPYFCGYFSESSLDTRLSTRWIAGDGATHADATTTLRLGQVSLDDCPERARERIR